MTDMTNIVPGLPTIARSGAQTAADLSWLWAALIGTGGSIVGGVIGGLYALRATSNQWQRDRQDARSDRSHQAASTIADAINSLEQEIVTWRAKPEDAESLTHAYNMNSQRIGVQSMALTDMDLKARVLHHVQLVAALVLDARKYAEQFAGQGMTEKNDRLRLQAEGLADTENRHANAVRMSLEAHVTENPLPAYQPLPLSDMAALLAWQPPYEMPVWQPPSDSPTN
jgi:hypothetical protein